MLIQDAKNKLLHEIFTAFVAGVAPCQSTKDLIQLSKTMMQQVADIVLPQHRVELIPTHQSMPQDIHKEESKDSDDQQIQLWLLKLTSAFERRTQKIRDSILQISASVLSTTQIMKEMEKVAGMDLQSFQVSLDEMNQHIKQLEEENSKILSLQGKVVREILDKIKKSVADIDQSQQQVSKFNTRLTEPIELISKTQNNEFPQQEEISFENYLTAIHGNASHCFFNFVFTNTGTSQFTYFKTHPLTEVRIQPASREIKKIVLKHFMHEDSPLVCAFQFYDKTDNKIYESSSWDAYGVRQKKTFMLEEGERIVGIKSRAGNQTGMHYDFQFVIGRLSD